MDDTGDEQAGLVETAAELLGFSNRRVDEVALSSFLDVPPSRTEYRLDQAPLPPKDIRCLETRAHVGLANKERGAERENAGHHKADGPHGRLHSKSCQYGNGQPSNARRGTRSAVADANRGKQRDEAGKA